MSQSLLKLRQSLGEFAVGKTDEDLLASLAQATGRSIGQVADAYQYAPTESGQWGNRVSGAIDSYQAGLWGVGEALGSETAGRMRRTNEFQANLARERASNQGAVMSYKDVDSLGSAANYVGGLLVDSAPYLGEAVVGGIAGRAVAGGLGLAAKGVSNAGRAGAVAASYPSAVGDILQNQREQAGTTDVGSAALLGIPYAAANMFGLEGAAGRLSGFRNTVKALDGVRGVTGGALRTAATVGGVGLTEGLSELGQEFINQAGRNVVDPNAGYFGPEAMDRYTESFIGGAALGGTMGGAAGGWRRSTPELPAPTPTDGVPPSNQFKDLMAGPPDLQNLMAGPPNLPGLLQGPPREAMYEQVETNPPAAPGVFLDSTGNYSLLNPTDAPQAIGRPVARGLMQGPPEPLMQVGLGARDYGFKYGDQGVLFDMPGAAPPVALDEATVAAPADTATPDMFPPGSPQMARTMFNPMSEPTTPMESALRPRTQGRGAVPAEISAQINRMVGGKPDPYSVKVAIEMSRAMDTRSVPQYIAEQRAALNKRMGKRYDITFGRDGPARAELEVLDEKDRQKYAILDAAEALSNRLLATEGAAQARPGMMVVARPEMGHGTELEMRQRNATEPLTEPTVEAPAAQAAEPVVEAVAEELLGKPKGKTNASVADAPAAPARRSRTRRSAEPAGGVDSGGSGDVTGQPDGDPTPVAVGSDVAPEPVRDAGTEGSAAELTPSKFADLERAFDEAQTAQALAFSKLQVANTNNARPAEIRRLKKARDAATAKFEKARDALEMAREADGADLTTEDAPVDRELNEDDKADVAMLDSEAAGADAAKTQVELNRRIDAIYSMFMDADSAKVREHARKILDDGFTAKDLADARERFERAQRFRSDTTSPLSPEQQLPQEALQGVVDRALSRTKTPPKVVILSDASEMPGGPPPAGVNPSGALRKGVIYLFRNMIGSELEASRTLFHELFHYGLNRLLPRDEHASTMRKLHDNNAKVREYALRWKASADGQTSKAGRNSASWDALAVEEALADIAEDINSGMKLRLRQLASWLADVAQRLGFTKLAQSIRRMPLNEVEQYVADTIQGALDWNGRKPPGDGGNETTYSSPRTPDNGLSAPPKAMSTLRGMYENAAGGWRTMPGALGWLTNGQIGDRFKFAAKATELVSQMSAAARRLMGESHSIDLDWAKIKAPERVQRAMLETTLQKMYILRPGTDPNNPEYMPLGQGGNKHLDPNDELLKDKYASLRAEFEAMSPLERKVYLDAQAKLSRDWEMMGELIKQSIVRAYEPTLGAAMRNPRLAGKFEELFGAKSLEELADLPARKRDVADARSNEIFRSLSPAIRNDIRALWSDVAEHSERLAQMQGPYFPLVRFGDYVVAFKSPRLIEERAELDRLQAELQELLQTEPDDPAGLDEQIAEAKKAVRKQRGIVESIQSNERDYVVEFHESRREAIAAFEQRKAEMLRLGASEEEVADQLRWERRTDYNARLDGASPAFLDKLESALTSSLPTAEANAVKASIRDIYIQSMPERSALKAQLRRIGAAGVKSGEMRRAFAFATLRNAWRLSRLQYGREINDEVNSLRLSSDEDRKLVGAELGKRLAHSMQFDSGNRIADVIANTGYIWHLGMSPAFLITNLMQPWVVSAPVMAAKFGSIGRTTNELRRATAEVGRHVLAQMRKDGFHFELNTAAFKGPGEAEMLASMFDKGKIDITLEHDLGAVAAGSTETLFGKVARMAAWPAHHTEVVNRVATALATYRLARARGMSDTQARSAVVSVLDDTHLDYTPENAPRLMRSDALGGFGRVVFQFKKYSQGMLYLLAKNGLDMVRGDKEAGKALMYLLGMQVAVAGTAGLPVVSVVGLIAAAASKAWDDDDEPELLAMLYSGLQDAIGKDAARAIAKGLPAALLNTDVSGQVGMGSIANPFAFANLDSKQGADAVAHATLALMGPAFGLAARWAEATVVAEKGDYVKATAMALPKVMSNIVQAADVGTRGLTTRNGDVLLTPEEAGLAGIPRRALGFQSTDATDIYDRRAAFYKMRGNRDEVRSELIRERSRATGDASELDQQIAEFNERHPESRIRPKDWLNRRKEELAKGSRLRQGLPATERDAPIAARLGVQ